jgi:hypothetical protein
LSMCVASTFHLSLRPLTVEFWFRQSWTVAQFWLHLSRSHDAVASNEIAPVKRVTVRRGRESYISMPSAKEVMRLIGIHTMKKEKGCNHVSDRQWEETHDNTHSTNSFCLGMGRTQTARAAEAQTRTRTRARQQASTNMVARHP